MKIVAIIVGVVILMALIGYLLIKRPGALAPPIGVPNGTNQAARAPSFSLSDFAVSVATGLTTAFSSQSRGGTPTNLSTQSKTTTAYDRDALIAPSSW